MLLKQLFGLGLLALGLTGYTLATPGNGKGNGKGNGNGNNNTNSAPEIDPSQALTAIAVLAGGTLILRRVK